MTAFAATQEDVVVVKDLVHERPSADSGEKEQRSFLKVNVE